MPALAAKSKLVPAVSIQVKAAGQGVDVAVAVRCMHDPGGVAGESSAAPSVDQHRACQGDVPSAFRRVGIGVIEAGGLGVLACRNRQVLATVSVKVAQGKAVAKAVGGGPGVVAPQDRLGKGGLVAL